MEAGLPAVGVSPFGSWETRNGIITKNNIKSIKYMLSGGLIPVLHGDVITYVSLIRFLFSYLFLILCSRDEELGCTILSGGT